MNTFKWVLAIGLAVASLTTIDRAHAAGKAKAKSAKTRLGAKAKAPAKRTEVRRGGGELQTDVSFDDSVLRGQYQAPEEAMAKVENEKGLSDLIGVRKHYKDRLKVAADQE